MSTLKLLKAYDSGSSSGESSDEDETSKKPVISEESTIHLKKPPSSLFTSSSTVGKRLKKSECRLQNHLFQAIMAAPVVQPNEKMDDRRHLDPGTKELAYNPKFDELYAPVVGPQNPNKTQQENAVKNTLAGYVEPAHLNDFQFELERRTFHSYGFAHDPSSDNPGHKVVTNKDDLESNPDAGKTVFEDVKARPKDKRKREKNSDPADIEGFLGTLPT